MKFVALLLRDSLIDIFDDLLASTERNVFFFGSVISHWAFVFQSGEQEFYRILITIVLVSVTDQYKSLTLAIHNQCVLKPYTCRP